MFSVLAEDERKSLSPNFEAFVIFLTGTTVSGNKLTKYNSPLSIQTNIRPTLAQTVM